MPSTYGGMHVPDADGCVSLEGENAKLKRLVIEAHLDMHALKSVLGVNSGAPGSEFGITPIENAVGVVGVAYF